MRQRLAQLLDRLEINLKLLEAYLIVKDPAAPKSAEAFDGMRQKIDGAYRARRRHVAQLAEIDRVLRTTQDAEVGLAKTSEYLTAEDILVIDYFDESTSHLFEIVGDRTDNMRVVSPAYVERLEDGRVHSVKAGVAQPESSPDLPSAETQPEDSNPQELPEGDPEV